MDEPQPFASDPIRLVLLWIGICALVNLLTLSAVVLVDFFFPLMAGAAGGQFGVLTVWAVFGPERLWVRWTRALLAAAFLYSVILVGIVFAARGWGAERFSELLLLPAVFLAAQTLLWTLRMLSGWEIVPRGARTPPHAASRQFGMRHLLGATAVVAGILALAKVGFFAMGARNSTATAEMWLGLAVACLVAAIGNGIFSALCLYAAMVVKDEGNGCFVVAGFVVVVSFSLAMVVSWGGPSPDAFLMFLTFHGTAALVTVGSLNLLRASGYVLYRPRAARTAIATEVAASPPGTNQPPNDAADADHLRWYHETPATEPGRVPATPTTCLPQKEPS